MCITVANVAVRGNREGPAQALVGISNREGEVLYQGESAHVSCIVPGVTGTGLSLFSRVPQR